MTYNAAELLERAKQAPEVTVYLPGGVGDVYYAMISGFQRNLGEVPKCLGPYIEALRALWPQLRVDEEALMLLACEIYLEAAEEYCFKIEPEQLIGGQRDSGRVYGNASRNDSSTAVGST